MADRISIGSDHAGYHYKGIVARLLEEKGYEVLDRGTTSEESVDYPDFGAAVGRDVSTGEARLGVVICGSGIGVAITANKVNGVRAANCLTPEMARLAREHNGANVLALGQRLIAEESVEEILDAFLSTEPSTEERHQRRVSRIHDLTGC